MGRLRYLLIYWVPVLLLTGLIVWASGDAHSGRHTSRLLYPMIQWLFPAITSEGLNRAGLVVRKIAHLTEYAALAVLLWRALARRPAACQPSSTHRLAWLTLWVVLLFSVTDEWHQSFVPTRQGTLLDVLIDLLGAATGLWLFGAFKRRPQPESKPTPAEGRSR